MADGLPRRSCGEARNDDRSAARATPVIGPPRRLLLVGVTAK